MHPCDVLLAGIAHARAALKSPPGWKGYRRPLNAPFDRQEELIEALDRLQRNVGCSEVRRKATREALNKLFAKET